MNMYLPPSSLPLKEVRLNMGTFIHVFRLTIKQFANFSSSVPGVFPACYNTPMHGADEHLRLNILKLMNADTGTTPIH